MTTLGTRPSLCTMGAQVFGGSQAPWRFRKFEQRYDADADDDPDVRGRVERTV